MHRGSRTVSFLVGFSNFADAKHEFLFSKAKNPSGAEAGWAIARRRRSFIRTAIARRLQQPTRGVRRDPSMRLKPTRSSAWPCSRRSLGPLWPGRGGPLSYHYHRRQTCVQRRRVSCTFPNLAAGRCYSTAFPYGARTFLSLPK